MAYQQLTNEYGVEFWGDYVLKAHYAQYNAICILYCDLLQTIIDNGRLDYYRIAHGSKGF